MTTAPRISVLIPAFNHAGFIEEAVHSALESRGDDLEVVIVDDGSTDSTPAVLQRLAGDPRVVVHRQENRGAHAALNRLLELSRGEYLFILNSDDAFVPGRIDRLIAALEADSGVAVACSFIEIIDGEGKTIGLKHAWRDLEPWPAPHPPPHLAGLDDAILALLQSNWASTTSNLAFRRRLIADGTLRFSPLRYTHDWEFLLAASLCAGITLVEEPLLRYRVHGANTIGEGGNEARGAMRFEILWTVARHAAPVLDRAAARGFDRDDLLDRWMRSAPTFGREEILFALLALRGAGETVPPSYDALLDPEHPYRKAAETALGG